MLFILGIIKESLIFQYYVSRCLSERSKYKYVLGVLVKLYSRVTMFLSFLLPIKILIMLGGSGSGGVPDILKSYFDTPKSFVIFLSLVTLFFFATAKISDFLFDRIHSSIVSVWLHDGLNKKDKNEFIKVVDRNIISISGLIFSMFCLVLVFYIYDDIFYIYCGWVFTVFIITWAVHEISVSAYEYIRSETAEFLEYMSSLSFFGLFFYIVYDVMFVGSQLSILSMVAGVILIRQASVSLIQFVMGVRRTFLSKDVTLAVLKRRFDV